MKIRALVYRVGKPPVLEEIDDDLEALQAIVGGHIECCYLTAHLVLVCHDEGLLENLPANRYVLGFGVIVGDFFVATVEGSDFVSLSDEAIALAQRMVAEPARFEQVTNDFRAHLQRCTGNVSVLGLVLPYFESLVVGRYRLSAQAGRSVYSRPRANCAVELYSHWEVVVFRGDEWLQETDPLFTGLRIADRFEPGEYCVAPYIPTAEVQELWERLCVTAAAEGAKA